MKFLIAIATLFTANVFAAGQSTDICGRFMTCGTYVHARDVNDAQSVETKITITSTGPMTANFDYTLTDKDGKSSTWPLQATFDEEGHAVMRWKGQDIYATAICKYDICNYALVPFQNQEFGIWGNAGLMRFSGTTLEFMMTVGTPTQYRSNGMILQKQ